MKKVLALLLAATVIVAAGAIFIGCGSSSDSVFIPSPPIVKYEAEINNTPAQATPMTASTPMVGNLATAGDVDFYSFSAAAGEIYSVSLDAIRLNQAGWDSNGNGAHVAIYNTDGTTKILEHTYTLSWWSSITENSDSEIQRFRVPATGTYYLEVVQDDPSLTGSDYAVSINKVNSSVTQFEAEGAWTTGANENSTTAEAMTPGVIYGFRVDGEDDYYSFNMATEGRACFEVTAHRSGYYNGITLNTSNYYDPLIRLFDTNGSTELDSNDDSYFLDSAICHILDPGTYYLDVEECCSSGDRPYFLDFNITGLAGDIDVGNNNTTGTATPVSFGQVYTGFMNNTDSDVDYFSFTGTAGDVIRLTIYDTNTNEKAAGNVGSDILAPDGTTSLSLYTDNGSMGKFSGTMLLESGTHYLEISQSGSDTEYAFVLEKTYSSLFETEPNEDITNSSAMSGGGMASGIINVSGDTDVFAFTAQKDELVTISAIAKDSHAGGDWLNGIGSAASPDLRILDSLDVELAASSYTSANKSYAEGSLVNHETVGVSFVAPETGMYYVEVTDPSFGDTYYYMIMRH